MKQWIVLSLAVTSAVACGDDGTRGIGRDTEVDSAGDATNEVAPETAVETDAVGDTSDPGDTAEETTPDTGGPVAVVQCDADRPCGAGACRSGVCIDDPPGAAVSHVTDPTTNTETDELPDLSCVDQSFAPPTQSATATLYGAVARFGAGRKTIAIHVDVLVAEGFDPSVCEDDSGDARKECYRTVGTPIGSALSAAGPDAGEIECERHEDCPLGYQCFDPADLGGTCEEQFGLYEVAGVPLDTPLVLRAYATTSEAQWHDTWLYNVILHADQVVDGRVQYDAQMVSEGQWILTTNTVGLPPMSPDNGAVGGRVRDCQSARDSWPIGDVRLGLAVPGASFVYFNDLEDDTVPLIDRETTDILGRFAALDVPAGWNRIAGVARVDGQLVTVGGVPVYVAPNSLSIVSWPGTQPYWRQR